MVRPSPTSDESRPGVGFIEIASPLTDRHHQNQSINLLLSGLVSCLQYQWKIDLELRMPSSKFQTSTLPLFHQHTVWFFHLASNEFHRLQLLIRSWYEKKGMYLNVIFDDGLVWSVVGLES